MRKQLSNWLLGIAMAFQLLTPVMAQMAQVPLLTQTSSVESNLVFVFDDSGSMDTDYMYQFGTAWSAMGMNNPDTSGKYGNNSPDVNMMYYDPRIQYKLRVNSDGSSMAAGPAGGVSSFNVYFYKPAGTTYKVGSVTVTKVGKNYPNTGMTMTFSSPSAGGVVATGTVVVSNGKITAINVTNGGSGYPATPLPSISLKNANNGKSAKFTVTMVPDSIVSIVNSRWDGVGSVSDLSNYFSDGSPAGYKPDAGSPLAQGATLVYYPNTASSSVSSYPKFLNRTDCTGSTCTWAQEQQNYANWLKYHSTRVELARTGIGLAFKPVGATLRLGWGTINRIEKYTALDAGVSLFTQTRKDEFYKWLYGSNTAASGDTPNRLAMDRVGQYYTRSDGSGPWGTNPDYSSTSTNSSTKEGSETASKFATCRRSNMMLLTDGYWNGASSSLDNIDGTDGPVILDPKGATYQYKAKNNYPYVDSVKDTLADVAMKYWYNDLQPGMPNNVTPTKTNDSFWQNVSFYGIGMGVYGLLPQTSDVFQCLNGGPGGACIVTPWPASGYTANTWPTAASNSPTAIDDMWHAAVNSMGQFLNARDSDTLTNSVSKMMSSINTLSTSQSGVAVSASTLTTTTRKYTPQYTTGDWTGNVSARQLDPVTGDEISKTPVWRVESVDPSTGDSVSTIPEAVDRQIFVGNGATSGARAVKFDYTDMNVAGLTSLMTGTVDENLINYLRGDPANEEGRGGNLYRARRARLGDIVNSSPVFVKSGASMHYEKLTSAGASTYLTYLNDRFAYPEGVLFVGANDGMLHAFRDGTAATATDPSQFGGEEIFAYVPRAVLPTISSLADKNYSHKYFVDGPMSLTDAYLGGAWANVLLGTTGAGAKAVFAIDVTDPLFVDGSNVMWEISASTTGFSNLGHVISDVQAGPTVSGDWVGILGNGYFSTSGKAVLYIVNLQTGAKLGELVAEAGPGNGLGGVSLVRDSQQRIIGAYAGDLKGNLWKFDLSGATAADWKLGFAGTALLALGTTKPMTETPAVIPHMQGGYLVSIGTGKFFEAADTSTTSGQSMYGIWDSVGFGSTASTTGVPQIDTSKLVQQTISAGTPVIRTFIATNLQTGALTTQQQSITYFTVSTNAVDWATKRGWFIDLPNTGERVVYPLNVLAGHYIAVDSISPNKDTSASANICESSVQGKGWVYIIDGLTGAGLTTPSLDTNGDSVIDSSDTIASGFTARADGRNTWVPIDSSASGGGGGGGAPPTGDWICDNGVAKYVGLSGGGGSGVPLNLKCDMPAGSTGIRTREWRQLFMR
jgi:type IV pilus assembly protein PilY1